MRNQPSKFGKAKNAIIASGVLLAIVAIYLLLAESGATGLYDPARFWLRIGRPLIRAAVFISIGLFAAQLIEGFGWTAKIGLAVKPLVRWARLPQQAGAAFTVAFASGAAANTFLYTAWQEGRMNRGELVLSNILNASLPAYFVHMPTTFFIILPLAGKAGLLYVLLTLGASILRFVAVIFIGRFAFKSRLSEDTSEAQTREPARKIWTETWSKFIVRARRMLLIIMPVYLVVFMAAESGFFAWLKNLTAGMAIAAVVPVEAMSVIIFSLMAEFTSGFAAAGALLEAGSLGVKEVVLALLIGNIISTPIRALRHQLPHYMGIYSPKMGLGLLAIGQTVRITSIIIVIIIFVAVY